MIYYLVSYIVVDEEGKIISGGIDALKSEKPQTLVDISSYADKYYTGTGVSYITSLMKITEADFEEYGGYNEIK